MQPAASSIGARSPGWDRFGIIQDSEAQGSEAPGSEAPFFAAMTVRWSNA